MDVRPGGASMVVMRSPEGQEFPNPGIFLEIVPNEKIVMTDAMSAGYRPAGKPFMVSEVLSRTQAPARRAISPAPRTGTKRRSKSTSKWAFPKAGP